jgi:UDP-glucuronate decarboxylase
MRQLADMVLKACGSKSGLAVQPLPPDDPRQRQPDIALAKNILDWSPTVPLEEGITATVEYFRKAFF